MIRAEFQQCMELVSKFKINSVTKNDTPWARAGLDNRVRQDNITVNDA